MTANVLLNALKNFTEESTKEMIFPVRMQRGDQEQRYSPATVYKMRLPDSKSADKKAPYIIHQLIVRHDKQAAGNRVESTAQIRSIFCVYCDDEQEGSLMLLELMERFRISILKAISVGDQFTLDRDSGIESLIYPDDTAPYFAGEMITTWRLPPVEREVRLV